MNPLAAGLLLGDRFELRSRLGAGATGEVWLVQDRERGAEVALKFLDPALASSPQQVERLRQEFTRLRELQHPHIVRVYDFCETDERVFIAMQYVPGGSLVQRRGAPLDQVLPPCRMVCDALEFAHRQGLVYLDLKPANVLVDPQGVAYLADFGLAAGLGQETGDAGGSLPYMSPQRLDGEKPAISDDVYGFGALLYELLVGQPLFHPELTPETVRQRVPEPPVTTAAGEAVPDSLRSLLSASLHKDAARRPAGMAAVRAMLEEAAADLRPSAGVIQPRRRRSVRGTDGETAPVPTARARAGGLPGTKVLAAFGLLLGLALVVVFLLPRLVAEREPVTERAPSTPVVPPSEEAAVPDAAASPEERARADEVLGELLLLQDRLREQSAERWGGADWSEAQRLAEEGDLNYRSRNYPAAATAYRRSLTLLKVIETRMPDVLARALSEGNAALLAGDRLTALDRYELALAIDGDNAAARRGLERAGRLGEVLALMSEATARESAGELRAAAEKFRAVLAIDPDWAPATAGLQRTEGRLSRSAYEAQMASGFEALARRDWDAGRRAFQSALRTRPGDPEATAALAQLAAEERLQRIVNLEKAAREAEASEDWAGAVKQYEAALALDSSLQSAQQGLERARQRLALSAELEAQVARADELNEEPKWQAARRVADRAREVEPIGLKLAAQIAALERVLRVAKIPVPVRFESDDQTNVVIYKVGRLGSFTSRTVELRPGSYVAVGTRDGYRDTRHSFRVVADGSTPTVVVQCEEPI